MPHIHKLSSTPSHTISVHSTFRPSVYACCAHSPGNLLPCSKPSSWIYRTCAYPFLLRCGHQRRRLSLRLCQLFLLCFNLGQTPRLTGVRPSQSFFAWRLSSPRDGCRPCCCFCSCCSLIGYSPPLYVVSQESIRTLNPQRGKCSS